MRWCRKTIGCTGSFEKDTGDKKQLVARTKTWGDTWPQNIQMDWLIDELTGLAWLKNAIVHKNPANIDLFHKSSPFLLLSLYFSCRGCQRMLWHGHHVIPPFLLLERESETQIIASVWNSKWPSSNLSPMSSLGKWKTTQKQKHWYRSDRGSFMQELWKIPPYKGEAMQQWPLITGQWKINSVHFIAWSMSIL